MTDENKRRNIASEVSRAQESLAAARALLGQGLANDAVSRAYYAAYHVARALLLTLGLEAKTHAGLARLVKLHFEVRIGQGTGARFARLQTLRHAADYDTETRFSTQEAGEEVTEAERFVTEGVALLLTDGWVS